MTSDSAPSHPRKRWTFASSSVFATSAAPCSAPSNRAAKRRAKTGCHRSDRSSTRRPSCASGNRRTATTCRLDGACRRAAHSELQAAQDWRGADAARADSAARGRLAFRAGAAAFALGEDFRIASGPRQRRLLLLNPTLPPGNDWRRRCAGRAAAYGLFRAAVRTGMRADTSRQGHGRAASARAQADNRTRAAEGLGISPRTLQRALASRRE